MEEKEEEEEIAAQRFKASAKEINQNSADAIVSVQTGCRTYQLEQEPASDASPRHGAAWRRRGGGRGGGGAGGGGGGATGTRTITLKTDVRSGDGTMGPGSTSNEVVKGPEPLFSHFQPFTTNHDPHPSVLLTLHTFIFNGRHSVNCCTPFHFRNGLGLWSPPISARYSRKRRKTEGE